MFDFHVEFYCIQLNARYWAAVAEYLSQDFTLPFTVASLRINLDL